MWRIGLIFLIILFNTVFAQGIVEEIGGSANETDNLGSLPIEKVVKISPSRRIYILTNSQNSFDKGDFITLVLGDQAVARALVAKTTEGNSGIKILKIYNSNLFAQLRNGSNVRIVRGDDSFLFKAKSPEGEKDEFKIKDEDDLFNQSNVLEDEVAMDENPNRVIKTDNLVSFSISRIDAINSDRQTTTYNQVNGSWAFQVEDNIWAEALYGQSLINNFPASTLDTKLANFVFRAKYTIAAPYFSYIMPYFGYQVLSASSPGAGVDDGSGNDFDAEAQLVEDLKKSQVIFGISILKRLVPGWFARIELGSDMMNFGFALEF
ncbi:MAG: hypothetical protein Fur0010_07380 [Bdellovibrio sp.]